MSLTALCYNWGFFTVLGYAPFPMGLSPIKLGLVFTGWGILVAVFAVFGAPRLQASLGIAKTMYANLAAFAVVVLVIAIWTTDRAVLIPAVIISGIFIGVNNTVTTQAVMTVSPVEKPVASAAYSFVRFIGGGLAPYAAGRMVLAVKHPLPVLHRGRRDPGRDRDPHHRPRPAHPGRTGPGRAGHRVDARPTPPARPRGALIPVEGNAASNAQAAEPGASVILAAVDGSPVAALVTEAAAVLAADHGGVVHVVHTQEEATAGDVAIDGESLDAARAVVRNHLDRLAAHHVPAEGQILLHAADHGAVGRMVAEYANTVGASTDRGRRAHPRRAARADGRQRQPRAVAACPQQRPGRQPGRAGRAG